MGNRYLKYRYSNFINVHVWCPVIKCIFILRAYSTGKALRYETLPSNSKSTSQRTQSLLIVKTKHRENIPACRSSCKLSYICPNLNKTILCKWILLKRKILILRKFFRRASLGSMRTGRRTDREDERTDVTKLIVAFRTAWRQRLYTIYTTGSYTTVIFTFFIFSAPTIERFPLSSIEHHDSI
jgi:hypothetical protein